MNAIELLAEAGRWSIEFVWLPMLVWTAIGLPVTLVLSASRGLSPQLRYGMASALMAALPAGVLAASFYTPAASTTAVAFINLPAVVVGEATSTSSATAFAWSTAHTAGLLLLAAAFAAAWRFGVLAVAALHLRRLRLTIEGARCAESIALQRHIARLRDELRINAHVRASVSDEAAAPMTFGWLRPVIVIPRELLHDRENLRLTLVHELVHIRRRDYAVQWLEQLLGALFIIHPLIAILRRETSFLREATCDAEVVRLSGSGIRASYARLLYSFSAAPNAPRRPAMGIFLQEHHLKKRITAMKHLADLNRITRTKHLGILLAALLFGASATLVACTEQFVESTETSEPAQAELGKTPEDGVYVIVEEMPELVGGLAAVGEHLEYPKLAKDAGIEGRVIVQFIVDENGAVQNPSVVKGVGSGLDEAALNAVKKTTFEPGMHNGKPVKVKMSLPVTFKLPSAQSPAATTP